MQIEKIMQWKQTRPGLLAMGFIALLLAYIVGSRAIFTGSLWQYALTLVLLVGTVKYFGRVIFYHAKQQ